MGGREKHKSREARSETEDETMEQGIDKWSQCQPTISEVLVVQKYFGARIAYR